MANIRIDCTADGFESNWIEYRPAWTRGDTKRLDNATDEGEIIDLIASKIAKCHITAEDGSVIDSPDGLTVEAIDELDETLAQWLVASIYRMIGVKRQLGNLSASASSSTNGRATIPTQTQAKATETA